MLNSRLRLAARDARSFGGARAAELADGAGRASPPPWTTALGGREIELRLDASASPHRDPALRLSPAAARALAGELLAMAGAVDGSRSD